MSSEIDSLREQLKAADAKVEKYTSAIATLDNGKRLNVEMVANMAAEIHKLKAENERLKSQKRQAQQAISNFHGTVGDLNDAILTIMDIDEVLSDFHAVTRSAARREEDND